MQNYLVKISQLFRREIDQSYLFYAGIWGIISGVALAYLASDLSLWWVLVVVLVMAVIYWRLKLASLLLTLILAIGVMIGWWRGSAIFHNLRLFEQHFGQTVEISGTVLDDVAVADSGMRSIRLSNLSLNEQSVAGKILISTRQSALIERGDMLMVHGKLEPSIGSYVALIRQVESLAVTNFGDPPTKLRDWLATRLARFLPSQQLNFVGAILLGKRQSVDRELSQNIRIVGLSHMIVASGLHLMIITNLVRKLFHRFSRRVELFGSLAVATMFALMAGLTASMMRALMTLTLSLGAWYYGRKFSGGWLISLLVAVSLLINPLHLLGDLSWWLSYGAFFGVLVAAPIVKEFFFGDKKLSSMADLILSVVVVQIVVSPILLTSFGNLSLIAIIANLLVVPCLVPLMTLAGVLILMADFGLLAQVVNYPLQLLNNYILGAVELLAGVPLASIDVTISSAGVLVIVVTMLLALILMFRCNQKSISGRLKINMIQ